jgi:hypothetical protein
LGVIIINRNPNLFFFDAFAKSFPWAGSGSLEDPFIINSLEDLIALRDSVNSGTSFEGFNFLQTSNIDLGKSNLWIPIGEFGSGNYFYGTYDGGSNQIINLNFGSCKIINSNNGGLFGTLGGQVLNLGIESGRIEGDYVGSIASHSIGDRAAIINCYNKATIIGSGRAGGICDNFTGGSVINCINYGNVSAAESAQIISYNADYCLNVFPIENAVNANYRGILANYISSNDVDYRDFLNKGIEYLHSADILPESELKYWSY